MANATHESQKVADPIPADPKTTREGYVASGSSPPSEVKSDLPLREEMSAGIREAAIAPSMSTQTARALLEEKTKLFYYRRIKQHLDRSEDARAAWTTSGKQMLLDRWEAGKVIAELYTMTVDSGANLMPFWEEMKFGTGYSEGTCREAKKLAELYADPKELASFKDKQAALVFQGAIKHRERETVAERKAKAKAEREAAIAAALAEANRAQAEREAALAAELAEANRAQAEREAALAAELEEANRAKAAQAAPETQAKVTPDKDNSLAPAFRKGKLVLIGEPGDIGDGPLNHDEDREKLGVHDILREVADMLGSIEAISTEEELNQFFAVLEQIDRLRGLI